MAKTTSEPVSKADPLEGRYAPSGFFNLTSTAKEKVQRKRKKKGLGPQVKKKHATYNQLYLLFGSSVLSKLAFMPFERMKTILQVHHLSNTAYNKPSGALSLFGNIVKNQGLSALYRGSMSMIYLNTMKMATNVVFYDRFKHYFLPAGDSKYTGIDFYWRKITSSLLAGTLTIALCYPFELMFTRITADMNGRAQNRLYLNTFDCFNTSMIHSENGYRVLYSGSLVALISTLPMTMIALPLYDMFKPMFTQMGTKTGKFDYVNDYQSILARIGASTLSGMLAMAAVYPLDTIKKCMQVIGTRGYGSVDRSIMTTVNSIYKAWGIRGFYRGLHLSMIKAMPAVYLQFVIYDILRSKIDYDKEVRTSHRKTDDESTDNKVDTPSIITGDTA